MESRYVLGLRTNVLDFERATSQIFAWARAAESRSVCAANVHMVMEAYDDPEFADAVNNADMITPDGMPLVWVQRLRGVKSASRVDGPTLTLHVCAAAARAGIPVGLYGGRPESLADFTRFAEREFPGLQIACAISPPFRALTPAEDAEDVRQITASGARILFVCLGCPKQERWMAAHRGQVPAVMLGVGAAVDFHTGRVPRAPRLLQRTGLEWAFRLAKEPRRLWPRYVRHNPRFLGLVIAQLLWGRRFLAANSAPRARVLVAGYRPPPVHGVSVAYRTLLQTSFTQRFEVDFVSVGLAARIAEIETFHWRKLWRLADSWLRVAVLLPGRQPDCFFYPLSTNRGAFWRDTALLWLARSQDVPILLYAHGSGLRDFYDNASVGLRWLIRRVVGWAAGAVVVGEALRKDFAGLLPADRVWAVPYGVPTPLQTAGQDGGAADPLVLFLSNLVPEKGVMELLRAAPQVRAAHPRVQFVFAGAWCRDADRDAAHRLVAELGLEDCVRFEGVVTGEAKADLLRRATVFTLPTYYRNEALPTAIIEALAAGVPVVTTRRAAIPDLITDSVNGLFVPERDAAALAKAIGRLLSDQQLREKMCRANQALYREKFTPAHYGARMCDVVEAVLARCAVGKKVELFGVPIDNLTSAETLARIDELIRSRSTHQHAVVNVDKIVKMHHDPALRAALLECDLISPDGQPIVWVSRLFGTPLKQRVTGIDLFEALIPHCAKKGYRVFLLGAQSDVLAEAVAKLKARAPTLNIVGSRDGYWSVDEEEQVAAQIRAAKPDVLFVAISSPKKELFINRWKSEMDLPFVMGVGGTLDVVAGRVRRAPRWMQRIGLEWLFRLLQEPRRMWRRYLIEDMEIFVLLWREWRKRRAK